MYKSFSASVENEEMFYVLRSLVGHGACTPFEQTILAVLPTLLRDNHVIGYRQNMPALRW